MKELTAEMQKKYSSAIKKGFINPRAPQTHNFCFTWTRAHPNRVTLLVRLKDILGRNPEWEDLTDDTLSDLKEDMELEMAPNSVRTICAELRAVLNRNISTKPIKSSSYSHILRSKKVPVQNVYLTPDELHKIHIYKPRTEKEAYVKEMFMRECLTGARIIDCRRMSKANIHSDGINEYLTYVAQKHPVEITVPVHKWLNEYMNDWDEKYSLIREDKLNGPLRSICRRCGIVTEVAVYTHGRSQTGPKWKFIASHTGRRTFATLLSLKGCPLDQIAIMMGHMSGNIPNVSMTAAYICEKKRINKSIISFFN